MSICEPESSEDFRRYYFLRWKILRKPLNLPLGSERDDIEDKAIHLMVCEKDTIPIAVARLHFNSNEEAQIRYMAVDEKYQGKGIGTMLLKELERRARERRAKYVVLNARESAVNFYRKNGYVVVGKPFILLGTIYHLKMRKLFK
ncbi:MAG TPA: N-acetyltransferase [Thermoplasmatales archaeon]|nr:N-acetyltransferase [Thermoplasmatales archaeon]